MYISEVFTLYIWFYIYRTHHYLGKFMFFAELSELPCIWEHPFKRFPFQSNAEHACSKPGKHILPFLERCVLLIQQEVKLLLSLCIVVFMTTTSLDITDRDKQK